MGSITFKNAGPDSEYSPEFIQGMLDRMAVSYHKYGAVADGFPSKMDAIACLKQRLALYEETGNTECMIDIANFAMIEFMCPPDGAYFEATDSDGSPGRTANSGMVLKKTRNDQIGVNHAR